MKPDYLPKDTNLLCKIYSVIGPTYPMFLQNYLWRYGGENIRETRSQEIIKLLDAELSDDTGNI